MNMTIFDLIEFLCNNSYFNFIIGVIIGFLIVFIPYSSMK